VQQYFETASHLGLVQQISASTDEFYRQMPFEVVDEERQVVDLRTEVVEQLRKYVLSGKADKGWVSL